MMTADLESRVDILPTTLNNNRTTVSMGMKEKRTYSLKYFSIRGRGEPIRMLFVLAGEKFEDKRVEHKEWNDMKESTPYGQLPILEIYESGLKTPVTLCQTYTIMRYVSREFGLGGSGALQEAKVDEIIEVCRDTITPITEIFNEKDAKKISTVLEEFMKSGLPKFLNYLLCKLEKSGWFIDKISAADVHVYITFDNVSLFVPKFLDGYDILQAWKDSFESDDRISHWLETRPVTNY